LSLGDVHVGVLARRERSARVDANLDGIPVHARSDARDAAVEIHRDGALRLRRVPIERAGVVADSEGRATEDLEAEDAAALRVVAAEVVDRDGDGLGAETRHVDLGGRVARRDGAPAPLHWRSAAPRETQV